MYPTIRSCLPIVTVALAFLALNGCKPRQEAALPTDIDPAVKESVEARVNELAARLGSESRIPLPLAFRILTDYLTQNPDIYGAAFAFADPEDGGRGPRSSPYVYRQDGALRQKDLADRYDYGAQPWYFRPVQAAQPVWSEPYFDEGGGDIWMITYSVPVIVEGRLLGVVTSDLPTAAPGGE